MPRLRLRLRRSARTAPSALARSARTAPSALARSARTAASALVLAVTLAGCTAVPPPLQGRWAELAPRDADVHHVGAAVRWGGRLVAVEPTAGHTCLRLIAQPLAPNGQPDGSRTSLGPFLACREGQFPTTAFRPNREITVTGVVEGFDPIPGGAPLPRVAADAVLLWPAR